MLQTITGSPRELSLLREALTGAQQANERVTVAFTMFTASHGVNGVCHLKEITDDGVVVEIPDAP